MYAGVTYVIPCGGRKLDRPAPARELYVGSMFRHTWANVTRCAELDVEAGAAPAARVLILSAKYGLVDPEQVLEPYDLTMGKPGSVTAETLAAQATALGIGWDERTERASEVYALLPRPYLARLDTALRTLDVYVQDVYEATSGILQQKRVNVHIGQPVGRLAAAPAAPDGTGPVVWLGGDVQALWWGLPVLVSYGRLREAKSLPVATAPWVLDSRAFTEIAEHGRWTIAAAEYVAAVRRYAREIGHLAWAAPQDWPAGAKLLHRTGLTEREHQERTVASVRELRTLAPDLPIICVVTGQDAAGYRRHIEMYRAAGIDLTAERLPVGVGALVGRSPREAAVILRCLHEAGLRNLHGFGVKGRVLDLAGDVLASVDSAQWQGEARRRGGRCRHGSVDWETNCPEFARAWGERQRARAVAARNGRIVRVGPLRQGHLFDVGTTAGRDRVGPGRRRTARRRRYAPPVDADQLCLFTAPEPAGPAARRQ